MQCLNIRNKEVAALLKEYTEILGDENAAYYVLSENNGYGLDKAPNGEPSKLYNDLLSIYNNDHSMAIRAKSMVYSDSFKNWFGDWTKKHETSTSKIIDFNDAVDFLFEVNPELSKVGTKSEYEQYIKTIFPNSISNSIYWHGTDSDFSDGLNTAKRGKGSGAPETQNEMYFNRQPWASLQYISGINRRIKDNEGFNNWVKLWWELKEALGNGRMDTDDWKNEIIGPNIRQSSPNKHGVFDRDKGGTHGKYLSERKARYGYENKSDKEFFEEVFDIRYGKETFNDWINRKRDEFKNLWNNRSVKNGIIPAVLNIHNPITEEGQNTYYEEQRNLFTQAKQKGNDAILSNKSKNEFGSDVAIIFNPNENVHFLGTKSDIKDFKTWKNNNQVSKVVDENGEPLIVYHGSNHDINVFEKSKLGGNTGKGSYTDHITGETIEIDSNNAFFASSNKLVAANYAFLGVEQDQSHMSSVIEDLISVLTNGQVLNGTVSSREDVLNEFEKLGNLFTDLKPLTDRIPKQGRIPQELKKQLIDNLAVKLDNLRSNSKKYNARSFTNQYRYYKENIDLLNKYLSDEKYLKAFKNNDPSIFDEEQGSISFSNNDGTQYIFYHEDSNRFEYVGTNGNRGFLDTLSIPQLRKLFERILHSMRKGLQEVNSELINSGYLKNTHVGYYYVNMKNPLVHDYNKSPFPDKYINQKGERTKYPTGYIAGRQVKKAIKDGNDGVIYKNITDPLLSNSFGFFNPNQIKSINNQGTFSTTDNNIYNQQSNSQTGTGRNQELASILQELYPNISIESLSDPKLRGQAQVEGYIAGKVLLNSLLENQDTLPHEYAHHYIAWFRNADIVQNGIKLFGSEESLVQAIGENSVKALKWYNRFSNWVKGLFSKKQRTLNSLTKSFLSGEILTDINSITETEVHNQEVIDKTYEKLIKATEARLRIAVHSANKDGIQTEKLQNLLSNLNKLENDKAVIEFINYMADDVTSATALLRTYRSMFNDYKNGLSASNPINADMLDLIRKGTIGFYDALVTNLKNMLEDPDVMDLYKSLGVYDSMLARINDSLSKYNDLRRHFDNLSNAVAKDNLIAEAKRYGSFTVEELQRKLDEGDSDISFWDRFLGQTQYNSNESIRLMLNSIMIAKGAVYDRKLAKGKKLLALLSKIDKSRLPLFYEKDKNGRRTGNFVRDLNFGQHEQDYMEHMLKLLDTFGVKVPSTMNFSDIPSILNPEQLKIWNKTKNEWDSKNTERKFTKEFYDLINNLSVDALAAKTQLDIDINSILDSTRDADGFAHKELLSKEKYEQYEKLMAAKRNLSNPFNMDGTAKTGKELEIAKEFQEYNKKLTKNIKYIANEDAFKKARAKAKRELTAEQFKLWEERNTVDKINEQFYEDLKKLSSVSQKSEKQEKYEYARQQLIRLYTVAGKPRIDDMPDRVKWLINTLDKLISTEAKRNADPGKKSRIMEIAEWEVNPEFYEQLNRMYYNSSPDAFRDWVNKNGYYNKDGQIVPASFWKRLVPRKEYADKYIDKVPDSSWIEMDKTSPYYNNNFDPSYGMSRVPKRSKYDNSANFNKLNKEEKALYDELFNTMIESNNMIVFKKHLNNGQLPQIEGGAWTLLNSQDTVLKGLGYMFKDRFAVKEDDPNAITDATLDPDGTGIRLVPTRFMKKLDNPEALTNDLVGSIIAYYGMAVNFQEMSKIAPKMEMYLNMLANQEFKNWRGERIRGRESSTYAKAEEMIKQFVYGMEEQDSTININVSGKNVKINFNKILSDIAAFTRLNGMANNINVVLTGLFTNKIQSRLDAISGIYYDNKALAKASKEVMLSYRHAIANIGNPNNKNKVLCALEWAGVVRDADTTFSKLNQSRWLRALNQHFWYGGYEIADYITKGKMAVAIMMSYKFDPETKKFVNKLTYMSRFKNKSEAEAKWDLLDTTAFDAFEMKDNMFTIKDEYAKYMDEVTANRIRNTIKQTGTRIDTQLTDLDKAYVSSNAYTKLLFIYRNFLLINLQTKFFTKRQYDYSTGMWQEAQYRGAFNYLWRHVLDKNKIKTLQEMYSNYDDLDEFERRLFKRSLYELIFSFVGLYIVSLVCKSLADDDPDNMFLQLMALVAVKVAIESRSNVSMVEATNMFTSPTAAWGIFQNFYKALTTIFDNPTEIVRSGAYKGKPRWFRSLVKITPFRAIYESKNFQEKRKYYDNMIAVF